MSKTAKLAEEDTEKALADLRAELRTLRAEFEAFKVEAREDAEDSAAIEAFRAHPDQDTLPSWVVDRLIEGNSPLAVYREHRGLSQAQLAEAAGTTASYVSQIETGHRDAGKGLRKRLSKALKIDEGSLL